MDLIKWLMDGDISIKYQTSRYLLCDNEKTYNTYRQAIHEFGWCKKLIDLWNPETKMWGNGIYSPKWISTTYTMLDLKNFEIDPKIDCYQQAANLLIEKLWVKQNPQKEVLDLCICGMLLTLCCYGNLDHTAIFEIVDALLYYAMDDGAWNCDLRHNPHHSSLHTTINVLEGFLEYEKNGYTYRLNETKEKIKLAHEFILNHRLYKSDKNRRNHKKSFYNAFISHKMEIRHS